MISLLMSALLGEAPPDTRLAAPTIISRKDWGAQPVILNPPTHTISWITVHHTGTAQNKARSFMDKLRGLQSWSQRAGKVGEKDKPAWPDIPYHFYIDWRGEIAECRPIEVVGDTNTSYDPTGHALVVLEGTFPTDEFNAEQRLALYRVVWMLAEKYNVPVSRITGHIDHTPGETDCPGSTVRDELPKIRAWVRNSRN